MDPITAAAQAITAVANMITQIVAGQPPEVKAQIWDWYVKDIAAMRDWLHLPK